uniref:DNA topoisomerase n=1 Tax=viral metagenome TaxID=1070528 RepID=A0A6C0HHD7_9ZZZZ
MSYTLIIVESPAKCNKIESYLGEGYKCAASFGHIRELADGLNAIDIQNNFQPTFKECEDKKPQIAKLRKLIDSAKEVILASDDDREGEAIAWHLCQVFGLPVSKTKRIVFHEITETALKNAVANPTTINMNIVNAQISRQVLDVLVGYKLSPVLWKYVSRNSKKGLSAGRCQTPALRLVYENQKEIDASPGKKVYTTTGYFTAHTLPFTLNYNHTNEIEMSTFLEASVNFDHSYSCSPLRTTIKQPPTPFTTSTLQQAANNELRISPKETMKICQTLYESGYITYMRTDSTTLSEDFIGKTNTYIEKTYGREYIFVKEEKEKKSTKKKTTKKELKKDTGPDPDHCAHEAIRPTDITMTNIKEEELSPKEIKMYALIHRNTLESCMAPATYKGFTAIISAPAIPLAVGEGRHGAILPRQQTQQMELPPEYRYSIEQPIFQGWKIVAGVEDNSKEYNYLQVQALAKSSQVQALAKSSQVQALLNTKNSITYKKITSKVSMKDLKSHLSEAKLVQLMEQNGIGRPSTFSSLVDKIQERGYVKVDTVKGKTLKCIDFELEGDELSELEVDRDFGNEKNKLVIQPTGILILEFLLQHFDPLFMYDYTKHMEDSLDLIAKGDKQWYELCRECLEQINILTNELKVDKKEQKSKDDADADKNKINITNKISIKVDEHHTYIIGKHGPVLKCTMEGRADGSVITFKPVREDIDMEKLKKGGYTVEELVVENKLTGHYLGLYDKKEVYLKNGKFGYYVEYGDVKKAVRIGLKTPTEVTIDDVADVLFDSSSEKVFHRVIDENTSIRNGKFGDYIFYKTKTMKKPQFIKLAGFKEDYKTCDVSSLIKWTLLKKV